MKKTLLAALCVLGFGLGSAVAGTATWIWPTQRTDNSALPLSAIGGFTIYDTSVPVPNLPGTPITGCTAAIPPTTATGTCTAAFTVGHSFVIVVGDNSASPILSAPSVAAVATAILSAPKPATGLVVIGP